MSPPEGGVVCMRRKEKSEGQVSKRPGWCQYEGEVSGGKMHGWTDCHYAILELSHGVR